MGEDNFDSTKQAVLSHIQTLFEEMEEEMAMSHQEKYALLEDLLENAGDEDELYVAFEQWYNDHIDDLHFDHSSRELWGQALTSLDE